MASSGNFATMNPLIKTSNTMTYSFGNLRLGPPSSSFSSTDFCRSSMVIPKDKKIYAEIYAVAGSGGQHPIAVATTHAIPVGSIGGDGVVVLYENLKKVNGTTTSSWITTAAQGDVFQIAVDGATNKVWLGYNNTWGGSGNPSAGSNEAGTVNTSVALGFDLFLVSQGSTSSTLHWNFGQDSTFGGALSAGGNADANGFGDFKYAPPTNFLALCSGNLSISDDIDPAQTDTDYPGKQFDTILYAGNSSSQDITTLGWQPDLLWFKNRGTTNSNLLFDSSRGATKDLSSDKTNGESTSYSSIFTAFLSTGWRFGAGDAGLNNSSNNYVAWAWKANAGTTSSNSDGSTDSTVQANTKAGFSIVQTPNYSGTPTFGHGLTKALDFIIVKLRASASQWIVYHSGLSSAAKILFLNQSAAEASNAAFNSTAPTNEVFSLGGGFAGSGTAIAYCWHSVEGSSKFGTYIGNANADGPFVYTGFRPRMIFVKDRDRGENWVTFDSARNTFNSVDKGLFWNASSAESTGSGSGFDVDFLSNGFKLRCSHDNMNGSSTYIYGAWGDVPFKYNNTF